MAKLQALQRKLVTLQIKFSKNVFVSTPFIFAGFVST